MMLVGFEILRGPHTAVAGFQWCLSQKEEG